MRQKRTRSTTCGRGAAMPAKSRGSVPAVAAPATEIDAGGRAVRVSNPDRVIFPPVNGSAPVTKLDIAEYYVSVGPGIMRALFNRPTTLERWPKGVHPGIVLSP